MKLSFLRCSPWAQSTFQSPGYNICPEMFVLQLHFLWLSGSVKHHLQQWTSVSEVFFLFPHQENNAKRNTRWYHVNNKENPHCYRRESQAGTLVKTSELHSFNWGCLTEKMKKISSNLWNISNQRYSRKRLDQTEWLTTFIFRTSMMFGQQKKHR